MNKKLSIFHPNIVKMQKDTRGCDSFGAGTFYTLFVCFCLIDQYAIKTVLTHIVMQCDQCVPKYYFYVNIKRV